MFNYDNDLESQKNLLGKDEQTQAESSCQRWSKQNPKKSAAIYGVVGLTLFAGGMFLLTYFLSRKVYFGVVSLTNESSYLLYDNSPDLTKIFLPAAINGTFVPKESVSFNVTNKNDYVHWQVFESSYGSNNECEIKLGTNTESSAATTTDCKTIDVKLGQCSYYPLSSSSHYVICDKPKVWPTQNILQASLAMFSTSKQEANSSYALNIRPS